MRGQFHVYNVIVLYLCPKPGGEGKIFWFSVE